MLPYAPWLCWIAPALGALLAPLYVKVSGARKSVGYIGATSIGLSALFSLSMIQEALQGEIIDLRMQVPPPLEVGLLIDPLSVLMAVLVSTIGLVVAVFSHGFMGEKPGLSRFWFIFQLFIAGYLIVVLADNLLFMFIGWEIVGLCCTCLTSFEYKSKRKAHLGLKVNTILRVGDVALLIFILTTYAYAGTFNFLKLSENSSWIVELSRSGLLLVSSLMFFGGVIGKAAQFPLHEWLPDMLVGTPSSSNALTECLAGPYLMARALPIFREAYVSGLSELSYFFLAVAWIGAITGLITALTATAQRHPQRVMAYSISSIIGFMLTALGLAGLGGSMVSGYLAGTTILTIDAFVSALLILSTVFVSHAVNSENLYRMSGFTSRLAYHGMEVAVFAMANVPPFSGFWLCNWVQSLALDLSQAAQETGEMILVHSGYGLFVLLILTGGVTAFYGLRLMGLIFKRRSSVRRVRDVPISMRLSFAGLLGVTMVLDLTVPLFIPLLNNYFFPIVGAMQFQNVFDVILYIVPTISTNMTIAALIVGGYLGRKLYITRKVSPDVIRRRYPLIAKIRVFFLNRCYIDLLFRKVADIMIITSRKLYRNVEMEGIKTFRIKGINEFLDVAIRWLASLSQWIYPLVEIEGFERFNQILVEKTVQISEKIREVEIEGFERFNHMLVEKTSELSGKIRETQTGVLSYNVLIMVIGAIAIAVSFLIFGGFTGG
ncbi:MAG: proton-conducting transporter membrane subunit [Candidatus Bathyarchaeota archaeon]|nr:proton-conducting transporter membrane subunit [Candidatus Bathyarchaeota archaeon]